MAKDHSPNISSNKKRLSKIHTALNMTLENIISEINNHQDEQTVYAKKVDGQFLSSSQAVLIELTEEEEGLPTVEIASKKCPGFDYFLEVSLIKELAEDLALNKNNLKPVTNRIIHYAEFDA